MKKQIGLVLSFLLLIVSQYSYAQNDAAKALLNKVSQKYNGYKTIQAGFTLDIRQANGSSHGDAGTLYLDKAKIKF